MVDDNGARGPIVGARQQLLAHEPRRHRVHGTRREVKHLTQLQLVVEGEIRRLKNGSSWVKLCHDSCQGELWPRSGLAAADMQVNRWQLRAWRRGMGQRATVP